MTDIPTEVPAEQPPEHAVIRFHCGCHNEETCPSPGIVVVVPIDLFTSPVAMQREFRTNYLRSMAQVFDDKIEELRLMLIARDGVNREPWPRDMVITLDVVTVPANVPLQLVEEPAEAENAAEGEEHDTRI